MKQLLLIVLGLVLLIPAYSQNYQTVNSSEVKLFKTNYNHIRGYRIDSVLISGNDSLLYPSRTIQNIGEEWEWCFDVDHFSMLGEYVRVMPNGTNFFFNKDADTIRINTMAQPSETWKVWKGEDFDVYGEMGETVVTNIFGIPDSVKSIKLNAYDAEMNLIEDFTYNDALISISKNHGLLTTFNFVVFPNGYEEYFDENCQLFTLYGIENKALGGDNLTTFEVYDFQPGDIIEYEKAQLFFGSGSIQQIREEFTSRENYPDSIVYGLDQTVLTFQYSGEEDPEISVSSNQLSRTIKPIDFLDELPSLAIANYEMNGYYSVRMMNAEFLQKQNLEHAMTGNTVYLNDEDDCYMPLIDGTCGGQPDSYYKGLGGPYHECDMFGSPNYQILNYFHKDSIEWGTPFDFTVSLANLPKKQEFQVFPNPAKDKLKIRLNVTMYPIEVEIVDLSGRKVFSKVITGVESEIDISNLKSGLYFVWFPLSGNKSVQKLVIR